MGEVAATGDGAGERGGVGQVAGDDLHVQAGQVRPVAGRADHHPDLVAARQEHPRDSGADEAGRSRYQGWTLV